MPLNIDWQQILLHLLNFAILAGGLYLLLYKPVKDFMAKRLERYEEREAQTRKREADADAMREKYQTLLREAEQEILQRREKVGEELEAEKRQQLAEARAEARKILSTAAKTAELRTRKALEDSHEEIRTLAIGMVERMLVESSGDALDQFLNEAESGPIKPHRIEEPDNVKKNLVDNNVDAKAQSRVGVRDGGSGEKAKKGGRRG